MLRLPLLDAELKTRNQDRKAEVWDSVRRQWVMLTPEEHVRQSLLSYLMDQMNYPRSLIAVERGIAFGHTVLRFDVVVYHRGTEAPWMLIECKSPQVQITEHSLHQLLRYHSKLSCNYWLLTNGYQTFCAEAKEAGAIKWLDALPAY